MLSTLFNRIYIVFGVNKNFYSIVFKQSELDKILMLLSNGAVVKHAQNHCLERNRINILLPLFSVSRDNRVCKKISFGLRSIWLRHAYGERRGYNNKKGIDHANADSQFDSHTTEDC